MSHTAALAGKHELFGTGDRWRKSGSLVTDFAEKRGEAVEVVLAPFFKRVMMTLGTFQSHTDKQLADECRGFIGRSSITVQGDRSVAKRAATCGDQFADKLIPRHSLMKSFTNPAVVVQNCLDADPVRVRSQQIHPLVGPVVCEVRFLQQTIHQLLSLVG